MKKGDRQTKHCSFDDGNVVDCEFQLSSSVPYNTDVNDQQIRSLHESQNLQKMKELKSNNSNEHDYSDAKPVKDVNNGYYYLGVMDIMSSRLFEISVYMKMKKIT